MIKQVSIICALVVLFSTVLTGCGQATIPAHQAGKKAEEYLNQYILKSKDPAKNIKAKFINAEDEGDFYKVVLHVMNDTKKLSDYNVLVTKSGNSIVLNPERSYIFDINQSPDQAKKDAQARANKASLKKIPKTDKTQVDLFVMSGCPFGVQIENTVLPVVKHLKDDVDINMHYIVNKGTGKKCWNNYCGMHGKEEAKENARQACIFKNNNNKYWDYIEAFNKKCKITSRVPSDVATKCSSDIAKQVGIDYKQVESCIVKSDDIFAEEVKLRNKYKASASPTIIINGHKYRGGRSSEDLLKAFCQGFKKAPKSCSTKLANASDVKPVSGGCEAN